jgi:GNAT superfamily N-acetyltransferase
MAYQMNNKTYIERLRPEHPLHLFDQVANIHREEIDSGFMSTLGHKFLVNMYKSLAVSSHIYLLAAIKDDKILGFICGSTDTGKAYKEVLFKRAVSFLPALLPKIISIEKIRGIIEVFFYPAKKQGKDLPRSEILNFCVSAVEQHRGIGSLLFSSLVDEFLRVNVDRIKIVTGEEQETAHRFYEKVGARNVGELSVHGGHRSFVYLFEAHSETKTPACTYT